MTSNHVAVIFIVGRYSLAGAMDHSSSRVFDVLNDANTEFLRVHGVAVFRGIRGEPIEQLDEITVPKSAIDCVLLTDYLVRGTVMLGRSVDPVLVLNSSASTFFPIVAASVSSVDIEGPPLSARVVFVNKTKVSLLQIEKRATARSTAV